MRGMQHWERPPHMLPGCVPTALPRVALPASRRHAVSCAGRAGPLAHGSILPWIHFGNDEPAVLPQPSHHL